MRVTRPVPYVLVMLLYAAAALGQESDYRSQPFNGTGVIVRTSTYFLALADSAAGEASERGPAGVLALVTPAGVYSFLETPHNQQQLQGYAEGALVEVHGLLLRSGRLLHVDQIAGAATVPLALDLAGPRRAPGTPVTLTGVNKCQCGLDVADLLHGCQLGHLHHLETPDGQLYHYLPSALGERLYRGTGSHFRAVEIRARLLPGHFLLVEGATTR